MKKNALDSKQLKALFPETPPAFTAFVENNLAHLQAGKETPVMKKKLSLGLVLALVMMVLAAAVAVAAIMSPTADVFGFLYGKEKKEALLKGDIAAIGQTHPSGELDVTLEEVVYQTQGDMPGLYGTGLIAAREGSKLVLVPEDFSVADPAGFPVHYGTTLEIPEDSPSYAELAQQQGARMLMVRVLPRQITVEGKELEADVGYSLIPQPDGSVRFAFEVMHGQLVRAQQYDITLSLSVRELDQEGNQGELIKDSWKVQALPTLTETAKAEIAAQTPVPSPTEKPAPAPGAIKMVGQHWSEHEKYMAVYPERSAANIQLEYGEWYNYIADPGNDWDVGFFFLSEDGSLQDLIKSGRVLDLSGSPAIMDKVKDLHPKIQEALESGGKTFAVPHAIFAGHNGLTAMREETWKQLGWSFDKAPKTFAELTSLAEEYMSLPLKTRKGTLFLGDGNTAAAARRVLLSELVNMAYSEAMARGDASDIDTPAFREGLTQIQSAYKALSKKQAAKDKNGHHYVLIADGGQSFLDSFGNQRLNLRLGDAPAFTQRLGVCVINADSKNKEAALQYVEWLVNHTYWMAMAEMNAVLSARDLARMSVEQNLLTYSEQGYIAAYGLSEEDKASMAKLEGMLASGDYGNHGPDEAALARYREKVAPNLTIMTQPMPVTYDIQKNYLNGKLNADAFIKALQEAAK